jgi:acyl-CoA oxidase
VHTLRQDIESDQSGLPEMHASSAGLKALCTYEGAAGLEECRKCCGGHGVLLMSGVAQVPLPRPPSPPACGALAAHAALALRPPRGAGCPPHSAQAIWQCMFNALLFLCNRQMALDYTTYNTAEGDRIILELQSARFLIKEYNQAVDAAADYVPAGLCEYLRPLREQAFEPCSAFACSEGAQESAHFKKLPLLLALFRARALNVVADTGARLRADVARGESNARAWNSNAIALAQCSRVHCWCVVGYGAIVPRLAFCTAAITTAATAATEAVPPPL